MSLTQEQIDSIVRMRGERCSIQSIADQLQLSKNTVLKYCHKERARIEADTFARIQFIADQNGLLREGRFQELALLREKLLAALTVRDFSTLETPQLLKLLLQVLKEARVEAGATSAHVDTSRRETKHSVLYDDVRLELDR